MNYQPFLGMNILVSEKFVAVIHYSLFNFAVIIALVFLGIYQTQRSLAVRAGKC